MPPHYLHLERKLEVGCELKAVYCGTYGNIIILELKKCAIETLEKVYEAKMSYGTAATLLLSEPLFHTNPHACVDSFFTPVAMEATFELGIRYTGVVSNANVDYPMKNLCNLEVNGRGGMSQFKAHAMKISRI